MRAITIGIVALLAAGGSSCGSDFSVGDRTRMAKLAVDQLVMDALRWSLSTDKECPDSLLAVVQHAGGIKENTIDPWGRPYELFCGAANLPPGASGLFAILSYGADKKKGTADDIASWRPRP